MGTRSNLDPDRPHDPDREAQLPEGQQSSSPRDELQVFGLVRESPRPDYYLHHALPLRPDGYFIAHPAHGD